MSIQNKTSMLTPTYQCLENIGVLIVNNIGTMKIWGTQKKHVDSFWLRKKMLLKTKDILRDIDGHYKTLVH